MTGDAESRKRQEEKKKCQPRPGYSPHDSIIPELPLADALNASGSIRKPSRFRGVILTDFSPEDLASVGSSAWSNGGHLIHARSFTA